jgi:hypothetical protein
VLKGLGLDASAFVSMSLAQLVNRRGRPFAVTEADADYFASEYGITPAQAATTGGKKPPTPVAPVNCASYIPPPTSRREAAGYAALLEKRPGGSPRGSFTSDACSHCVWRAPSPRRARTAAHPAIYGVSLRYRPAFDFFNVRATRSFSFVRHARRAASNRQQAANTLGLPSATTVYHRSSGGGL